MIVMKFGGSSLKDSSRIREVITLIKEYHSEQPIIVCSALGKTTDKLLLAGQNAINGIIDYSEIKEHHYQILSDFNVSLNLLDDLFLELQKVLDSIAMLKEIPNRISDLLVSFGERLAVRVASAALNYSQIASKYFDAFDLGFTTDSRFSNAEILPETYSKLYENCKNFTNSYTYTPVITGFIAKDKQGNITTLGRSGSDLTASVIGAALKVKEVQVWKDVDGLLSADPRIVKNAHPVGDVSFEEASELAYFGAKVLHPLSIQPAMIHNVPVRVKNSYNHTHSGTLITANKSLSVKPVKAITYKKNITLIDIVSSNMLGQYGFLAYVFNIFGEHKISVDMVATSEVSISLTLDKNADFLPALNELKDIASVKVSQSKSIISLICDTKRSTEILSQTFRCLTDLNINVQMISQGASKVNISFVIDDEQAEKTILELHKIFFENDKN